MTSIQHITLDVSGIYDEETLHEYFSKTFDFPAYYGFNFDAFWDCLQEVETSYITVTGLADLAHHCSAGHAKLLICLQDYQKLFPNRKVDLEDGDVISPPLCSDEPKS